MPPTSNTHWEGLSLVATVSGILVAQVLKSKLESANIPVLMRYESAGIVFGITAIGSALSQVHILVPDEYADVARQLVTVLDGDDAQQHDADEMDSAPG